MSAGVESVPLRADALLAAGAVLDAAFERRGMVGNLRVAHALQPENWLCARRGGEVVALVGAVNYGAVASIGMMAVHPSAQRQSLGERLMRALVDLLESRGCPVLILEASGAGQRLYPRVGFLAEGETLRMLPGAERYGLNADRPAVSLMLPCVTAMSEGDFAEVVVFDAPLFGANRRIALEAFRQAAPERALVAREEDGVLSGYILSNAAHIGPWTASSPAAAEALLRETLRLSFDRAPALTFPANNSAAAALLARYGFVAIERLLHMRRGGASDPRRVEFLYGQASLTLG